MQAVLLMLCEHTLVFSTGLPVPVPVVDISSSFTLLVTTTIRSVVCLAAALNDCAHCQQHWFLGTKSAWFRIHMLTSCSKCQHSSPILTEMGALQRDYSGKEEGLPKGRVTIPLLEFFLSGNKGTECSEMYKCSLQLQENASSWQLPLSLPRSFPSLIVCCVKYWY